MSRIHECGKFPEITINCNLTCGCKRYWILTGSDVNDTNAVIINTGSINGQAIMPMGNSDTAIRPTQHRSTEVADQQLPTIATRRSEGAEIPVRLNATEYTMRAESTEIPVRPEATEIALQPGTTEILMPTEAKELHVRRETTEMPVQPETTIIHIQPEDTEIPVQPNSTKMAMQPEGTEMPVRPEATEIPMRAKSTEIPVQPNSTKMAMQPEGTEVPVRPEVIEIPVRPEATVMPVRPDGTNTEATQRLLQPETTLIPHCTNLYDALEPGLCEYWASKGECAANEVWMVMNCRRTCVSCNNGKIIYVTY